MMVTNSTSIQNEPQIAHPQLQAQKRKSSQRKEERVNMACGALSASSCNAITWRLFLKKDSKKKKQSLTLFRIGASTGTGSDETDCNVEECAPDKEVGKVSMEWLAGEKTKVAGTFPPRNRGWTGYVEKDTAGQTNIYSVEPPVYVAESAISSGNAGSSADGVENTVAIAAGIALISVAAASSILLQVGKNPPPVQTLEYSGPSLSYYVSKFKPPEIAQASTVPQPQTSAPEVSQIQLDSGDQPGDSSSTSNISS